LICGKGDYCLCKGVGNAHSFVIMDLKDSLESRFRLVFGPGGRANG
jgi:hypothetical protein